MSVRGAEAFVVEIACMGDKVEAEILVEKRWDGKVSGKYCTVLY